MRISDWSSDVCSSDLGLEAVAAQTGAHVELGRRWRLGRLLISACTRRVETGSEHRDDARDTQLLGAQLLFRTQRRPAVLECEKSGAASGLGRKRFADLARSEEHTSELQSLMRNS